MPAKKRTPKKSPKKAVRMSATVKFRAPKPDRPPLRIRKNMDMDPTKLEAVRSIFGVSTETEAVDRAFDEIIFEHRVAAGLEGLAATGGLPSVDPEA